MTTPLRVLIVEDSEDDAQLLLRELRRGGYDPQWTRVDLPDGLTSALARQAWDVIICDYALPHFGALAALNIARESKGDIPFIIVSGKIGEDTAVAALKAGAHDYVMKDRLERLPAAVEKEIRDAAMRHEHERVQARLLASEALTRGVLENLQDAYVRADLEGRILIVSPSAVTTYGYGSMEEMIGLSTQALYATKEERAGVLGELKLHGSVRDRVGKGRKKDGTLFWVSLNARFFKDAQNQVVGAECFVRDVSDRMRTEAALQENVALLQSAGKLSRFGGWSVDVATNRCAWSDEVARIHEEPPGYSPLVEDGINYYAPEWRDRITKVFTACARDGTPYDEEMEIITSKGERVWVRTCGDAIRDESGKLVKVYGGFQDITERKCAEEERIKLEEQLRASQKMEAIGSLAGGVAHDFNNLLSVILSYTGLVLGGLREGDPHRDDLLEVKKAADRAVAVTRQLLAFGRKQVLQPVPLDLNQIAIGVEKMLRHILGEDIDFVQKLAPDLGLTMADPGQIEQVLMNLVVNARDAMPDGGKLTIETANVQVDEEYAAAHVAVTPGPYVQIAVTDTGCGMDEQTRARLFEPFFTTKEKGKGTGLGLSTVYGIVKQSGGNIWVYSELGQGTTVKIYLPRDLSATTVAAIKPATIPTTSKGTETILVVEDEEALRKVAKRSLEAVGYTVLTASDGEEALLVSAKHGGDIQLLLTDVVMPRMGGRVLAQELAKTRPTVKVVYMSGYTDDAIVHHGVLDPGTHFLPKPFTSAAVTQKVRQALDSGATHVADGHGQTLKADIQENEQPLHKNALRGLPADVLARLRQAVIAARYNEIVEIIETIRITEPNVATELRRMADLFDYDGMRDILSDGTESRRGR